MAKMTFQEFDEAVVDAYGCELSAPMEIMGVALVIRNFLPESDFLGINEFSAWMSSLIKIAYREYLKSRV